MDTIRFVADSFTETTWAHKYDGGEVEISGEVDTGEADSLARGIAIMTLHSMTAGERYQKRPVEALHPLKTDQHDLNDHAPGQPLYRFAYYLVLLDTPKACERCYVPLLISPEPIERIATDKNSVSVVSITTYERDSIWQLNGLALITSRAVGPSNTLDFRGRNYRYESVPDTEVLHLLEHPLGTIPISRRRMPQIAAPGASVTDLIADFHVIFRVRERRNGWPDAVVPLEKSMSSTSSPTASAGAAGTSELTVFDNGKVKYRLVPGCIAHSNPAEVEKWHETSENWNWRETCPGSQSREENFDYSLKTSDFAELKTLLNTEEVRQWHDCFCNAAIGLGDYFIEISRQDLTQRIPVLGFMPEHIELREHPALTRLVCEAKTISQQVTKQALPSWCSDLPAPGPK